MAQPTSLASAAMNFNIPVTDNQPSAIPPDWPQVDHKQQQSPSSSSEEISYIGIENDPPPQDEELPRKLPKKVPLSTTTTTDSTKHQDPVPPPLEQYPRPSSPKLNTVLERSPVPRFSAKSIFQDPSLHFPQPTPTVSTTPAHSYRIFASIHTLRSHLLPVRALIPCNTASALSDETCFISAGDDSTVKFWRVSNRPGGSVAGGTSKKKAGNFDILPQITFRGHSGMVTCLAEGGGFIWSGGVDAAIRGWCVPPSTRDAYGSSGTSPLTPL